MTQRLFTYTEDHIVGLGIQAALAREEPTLINDPQALDTIVRNEEPGVVVVAAEMLHEVNRRISSHDKRWKIVNYREPGNADESIELSKLGALGYATKPQYLRPAVAHAKKSEYFLSPEISVAVIKRLQQYPAGTMQLPYQSIEKQEQQEMNISPEEITAYFRRLRDPEQKIEEMPKRSLSNAEKEVALAAYQGFTNKQIAAIRGVSEPTIKTQLHTLFKEREFENRRDLGEWFAKTHPEYKHPQEIMERIERLGYRK